MQERQRRGEASIWAGGRPFFVPSFFLQNIPCLSFFAPPPPCRRPLANCLAPATVPCATGRLVLPVPILPPRAPSASVRCRFFPFPTIAHPPLLRDQPAFLLPLLCKHTGYDKHIVRGAVNWRCRIAEAYLGQRAGGGEIVSCVRKKRAVSDHHPVTHKQGLRLGRRHAGSSVCATDRRSIALVPDTHIERAARPAGAGPVLPRWRQPGTCQCGGQQLLTERCPTSRGCLSEWKKGGNDKQRRRVAGASPIHDQCPEKQLVLQLLSPVCQAGVTRCRQRVPLHLQDKGLLPRAPQSSSGLLHGAGWPTKLTVAAQWRQSARRQVGCHIGSSPMASWPHAPSCHGLASSKSANTHTVPGRLAGHRTWPATHTGCYTTMTSPPFALRPRWSAVAGPILGKMSTTV